MHNSGQGCPKNICQRQKEWDKNITLADWLQVFKWMDDHPLVGQKATAQHFKDFKIGCLTFSQPTLSQNLKKQADLEA